LNSSEHLRRQTCKSVQYFLSYSGFKSRPSFSITLYYINLAVQKASSKIREYAQDSNYYSGWKLQRIACR